MKLLVILFFTSIFLTACSDPLETRDKCPCKVMIPQLQPDGSYKREIVEFKTLESPRSVESSIIRITLNPRFFANGSVDETTPNAQYIVNEDGVLVSTRASTEEMFASYKAMEELYFYDLQTGASKYLTYPRVLSLETKTNRKRKEINNASYITMFDRILLFKYFGDQLALSFNPGIIAHEHFHAIFSSIVKPIENTVIEVRSNLVHDDGLVHVPITDKVDRNLKGKEIAGYNFLLLKSLDEGLADFWAHIHTRLNNPYLASYKSSEMGEREVLPRVMQLENQHVLDQLYSYDRYIRESQTGGNVVGAWVYSKATTYSNLFKALSTRISAKALSAREEDALIGKWIVESLERLSQVVERKARTSKLSQVDILNAFVPDLEPSLRSEMCSDIEYFLTQHNQEGLCQR